MSEEAIKIIQNNKLKRAKSIRNNNNYDKEELPKNFNYIKNFISRCLITVIFVLLSIIFTNSKVEYKNIYQEYVLQNSLSFNKINEFYQSLFGHVDIINTKEDDTTVFKDLNYLKLESYDNSSKLSVSNNEVIPILASGIVVFIGEKDNLGNTIIVQGNDGADIWYSNITNSDISIYDYVSKGSIIGESNSDYIYLTIIKDGNYLTYEEYQEII